MQMVPPFGCAVFLCAEIGLHHKGDNPDGYFLTYLVMQWRGWEVGK